MPITYRTWRDASDWAPIVDVLNAEALADDTDYLRSVEEMAVERRPHMDPAADIFVAEADRRIVGVAFASWAVRDNILTLDTECGVHPDARRQGIGTALLRRAQERLAESSANDEPSLARRFHAWIASQQSGAVALLGADGYEVERYGYEMVRRDLGNLAPQPLADGFEIRAAAPAEVPAILVAENEAFRDHPGHREWTADDTVGVFENPNYDPSLWRVAWDGDEIAGAVESWISASENAQLGVQQAWLARVSVRRPWRQRGLARALIAESFAALHERGITEAMLSVDAENPSGALRFYESMGFERLRTGLLYGRPA